MAAKIGNKYSPGRPKGTVNKATAELKDMILGALDDAGGRKYLAEQARANPGPFMGLIGKVLPKDVNANMAGTITVSIVNEFE